MNKKVSLDIFAYFFKFIILAIIGVVLIFSILSFIDLFEILFSSLERRLCTYDSVLSSNNIVSKFIMLHYIDSFGSSSYSFMNSSTSVLSITNFLNIFEVLKYFYLLAIGVLSFILFNDFSKNKIYSKKNKIIINIIGLMIVAIPLFYVLRDIIGCSIIDQLVNNKEKVLISDFKIFYLIIGLVIIFINNFKSLDLKNKYLNIALGTSLAMIAILFFTSFISNTVTFINVLSMSSKEAEYYELIKNDNPFINVLVINSFKIFGDSWTHLGLYTKLKTPMIIYYSSRMIVNLFFTLLFANLLFNNIKYKKTNINKNLLLSIGVILLLFIIDLIKNCFIVYNYKNGSTPNPNLKYSIVNLSYLYPIIFILYTMIINLKNTNENEKEI